MILKINMIFLGRNKRKKRCLEKNKRNISQKQSKDSLRTSELSVSSTVKTDRVINGVSRMVFGHKVNTYFRSKGELGQQN